MDLITAWRFLLKRPTSTAIAVLTLGNGEWPTRVWGARHRQLLFSAGDAAVCRTSAEPGVLLNSAIAWFAPARRAAAVDPVSVLKSQ